LLAIVKVKDKTSKDRLILLWYILTIWSQLSIYTVVLWCTILLYINCGIWSRGKLYRLYMFDVVLKGLILVRQSVLLSVVAYIYCSFPKSAVEYMLLLLDQIWQSIYSVWLNWIHARNVHLGSFSHAELLYCIPIWRLYRNNLRKSFDHWHRQSDEIISNNPLHSSNY
jgi:hypothetical protein